MLQSARATPLPLRLLLGAVAALFIVATFRVINNSLYRGATDIYPTWKGAQLFLEEGLNPYDSRVGDASQEAIYGRPATEEEDQFLYVYPFFGIFYLGPLALLDFQLAATIYMQALFFGMLLVLGLVLHTLRWRPAPLVLAILLLWTMVSYFVSRGLLLAQPALLAYVAHSIALWAIIRGEERAAGVALAISTIKPQTSVLIVPLLLLWAWRMRRWGVIYGFAAMFGLLAGLSFILQPSWLNDWIGQIFAYRSYTETVPAAHVVARAVKSLPLDVQTSLYLALSVFLLIPVVRFWKASLNHERQNEWLWGFFLTMNVTVLIVPRVATTYYVELYPVLYITAMILARRRRGVTIFLAGVALLIFYWVLHLLTIGPIDGGRGGFEAPIVYVVFPVMTLALLFIYRQQWPTPTLRGGEVEQAA